jgi:hypothetical protein
MTHTTCKLVQPLYTPDSPTMSLFKPPTPTPSWVSLPFSAPPVATPLGPPHVPRTSDEDQPRCHALPCHRRATRHQEDLHHRLFLPHLEHHEWEHLTDEGMHTSGTKEVLVPEDLTDSWSMSEEQTDEIPIDAGQDPMFAMRMTHWSGSLTRSSIGSAWVCGLQQQRQVHPHRSACATVWGLTNPHIGSGVLALMTCWNKL